MSNHSILPVQPHRALQIDEILRNIFDLCRENNVKGGYRALARCARVSRAFKEPALDVLWDGRDICLVRPLLHPLSSIAKADRGSHAFRCGQMTWLLAPHPRQWARLEYYARKVRYLSYNAELNVHNNRLLEACASYLAGKPLFPRLISISWRQLFGHTRAFSCVVSPSLCTIDFQVTLSGASRPMAVRSTKSILEDVGALTSQVSSLSLDGIMHPAAFRPLVQFKNLRAIDLRDCAIDAFAIRVCARMENLVELKLNLKGGTIPVLTQALKCITSPVLKLIMLTPRRDSFSGPAEARDLLAYIAGAQFAPALRWVQIFTPHVAKRFLNNVVPPATVMDVLEPLLGLRNLSIVVLDLRAEHLTITGDDFRRMARAWPNLALLCMLYDTSLSEISVTVVAEFAVHCPSLRSIFLPLLDHKREPLVPTPTPAHRLHCFRMCVDKKTPVNDLMKLMPYITRLFYLIKPEWRHHPDGGLCLVATEGHARRQQHL
ncbi:hypothetical protein B0H21DRAFT_762819 [Amylocystis lapponica]|nr:hypothetical protein B0H21DRAFT_762819 [Amylocystis lapponica]